MERESQDGSPRTIKSLLIGVAHHSIPDVVLDVELTQSIGVNAHSKINIKLKCSLLKTHASPSLKHTFTKQVLAYVGQNFQALVVPAVEDAEID